MWTLGQLFSDTGLEISLPGERTSTHGGRGREGNQIREETHQKSTQTKNQPQSPSSRGVGGCHMVWILES